MQFASLSVFPLNAGIQKKQTVLDPGFRRENGNIVILRKSWHKVAAEV